MQQKLSTLARLAACRVAGHALHGAGCLFAIAGIGKCTQLPCTHSVHLPGSSKCLCAHIAQAEGELGEQEVVRAAEAGSTYPESACDLSSVPSTDRQKAKWKGWCMQDIPSHPYCVRGCMILLQARRRQRGRARRDRLQRQGLQMTAQKLPWLLCWRDHTPRATRSGQARLTRSVPQWGSSALSWRWALAALWVKTEGSRRTL